MTSIYVSTYPALTRAVLDMAYDNGAVNRDQSEEHLYAHFAGWACTQPEFVLREADAFLAALTEDELRTLTCGEEEDAARIAARGPAFLGDLLVEIFDEVVGA